MGAKMLLTYTELLGLVSRGVVTGVEPAAVNGASIDVHLSGRFLIEDVPEYGKSVVDLGRGQSVSYREATLTDEDFLEMPPGVFLLASTREIFNIPADIGALFVMKSSLARSGLDQMNAAWCSPGWTGSSLTLELMNVTKMHHLWLRPGMPIGQVVFFRGMQVPEQFLYRNRGRFNFQPFTASAKGGDAWPSN